MKITRTNTDTLPGYDGSEFTLYFDKPFAAGDVITYDKTFGQKLFVNSIVPQEEGDFKTNVRLFTNYKQSWFLTNNAVEGTEYIKL